MERELKFYSLLAAGLLFVAGSNSTLAQVTASVTGTVKDTSGVVVPGTTVTVKHIETGLTRTAETDTGGNYAVPSLPMV